MGQATQLEVWKDMGMLRALQVTYSYLPLQSITSEEWEEM